MMIVAAFVCFAVLVVCWLLAPVAPRTLEGRNHPVSANHVAAVAQR